MRTLQVGEFVCKVGENAKENWELVDQSKKHHWFFHLTDFPSPYVVLECDKSEPNSHIREQCAEICVEQSKQRSNKKVKVDATPCGNVRVDKKDEVGECDYKNEGKVEIIVVGGGKSKEGAREGNDGESKKDVPAGKSKGQGQKASEGKDKFVEASGEHVNVKKSIVGGWATISFQTAALRDALMRGREEIIVQGGVAVKLQAQVDASTKEPVPTQIFASWGRKAEEKTPISEVELLRCFEALAVRSAQALERAAPARAVGAEIEVRKAAVGGCAVIAFQDAAVRSAVLALGTEVVLGPGVVVKLRSQHDPKSKEEVPHEIFAAWGRKIEEATPVSEGALLRCIEGLVARTAGTERRDHCEPQPEDCDPQPAAPETGVS